MTIPKTINTDTLLKEQLKNTEFKNAYDLMEGEFEIARLEFFGTLEPAEDPLEFQKKARAEWNEREKSF